MTTPALYDTAAQHARDLAVMSFLDLNLGQWERWALAALDSDTLPRELEPYVADVIAGLRGQPTDPFGALYLRAIASLSTSALQYFIDRVGKA